MQHTNFMVDLSIFTTTHTGTSTLQADGSTTTVLTVPNEWVSECERAS